MGDQAFDIFQDEYFRVVMLDVVDHGGVDGATALGVFETFTFAGSGKRLAREAGHVNVDVWCGGVVTLCTVVEYVLWCVVGLDSGADVWVNVTAEQVVVGYVEVAKTLDRGLMPEQSVPMESMELVVELRFRQFAIISFSALFTQLRFR